MATGSNQKGEWAWPPGARDSAEVVRRSARPAERSPRAALGQSWGDGIHRNGSESACFPWFGLKSRGDRVVAWGQARGCKPNVFGTGKTTRL